VVTLYSDTLFTFRYGLDLVYADDVKLVGHNSDIVNKKTEILIGASNELG
jgi:hypothetical protein